MNPYSQILATLSAMLIFFSFASTPLLAKTPARPRIEPGLDLAVKWKWSVQAQEDAEWGLRLRDIPTHQAKPDAVQPHSAATVTSTYEVKKGDVLVRIARKFKVSTSDLIKHNQLSGDLIHIGQILQIPPPQERRATIATPSKGTASPATPAPTDILTQRVFLDRQGFSTGPITDSPTADFERILHLYQSEHGEIPASSGMASPMTDYTLRASDLRFISPHKSPVPPPPAYNEMVSASFLAYRSPWEFVAERFHCDESFLRKINPVLGPQPSVGASFRVPNVTPFEIENVPVHYLQPASDPAQIVTACIKGMSVLEIRKAGKLVAAMPLSKARPGLTGRGEWKILDSISRPSLATQQEPRVNQVESTSPFYTNPNPTPTPAPSTVAKAQVLPPGPNNPAGVLWINLAKGGDTDPLPFGLHGTSQPSEMNSFESLGGFRVSNWDIIRAARLLPNGTQLQWKP